MTGSLLCFICNKLHGVGCHPGPGYVRTGAFCGNSDKLILHIPTTQILYLLTQSKSKLKKNRLGVNFSTGFFEVFG